ncbi:MAG: CRISPR-associated endonuclease Cas1 [Verrucomicrobiia bacterium]
MFRQRFPDLEVESKSVKELRGLEGLRVRALYTQFGLQHGVTWKGRNYDRQNWDVADNINRALSTANASLYALCAAVICSLGYLPSLGFVHDAGTLPFVYDVADLYKHLTSIPAAFLAVRQNPEADGDLVRTLLKQRVERNACCCGCPRTWQPCFKPPNRIRCRPAVAHPQHSHDGYCRQRYAPRDSRHAETLVR